MRKIFIIATIFLGIQFAGAQQKIVKNVGSFTTVRVFDKIPVELIESSEGKVEVSGDKSNDVEVINKNGELKIRMTALKLLAGDDVKVTVYYKELNNIQASEGADILVKNKLNTDNLLLSAKEGAKIEVEVNVGKITSKVYTGGEISVSGKSKDQNITITSGGQYYGKSLSTKNTSISISAGGNAEVKVSEEVKARIKAGGKIDIYGKPNKVDQNSFAGGKIIVH